MTDSRNKKLIRGTLIYAVGTFGTKILSFLIVPLYTYYIATSDFGVYDVIMSTIGLLTPLVTMQISDAAYRYIIRKDEADKERYILATLQVLIINCLIASVLILGVSYLFEIPYLLYFILVLSLSRIHQTLIKVLRGLERQWLFAISGIVYTGIFLGMSVLLLVVFRGGVESLFQSTIAASIITILVMLIFEKQLRVNIFKKPDKALIKEMYKYSVPLVPNYLNWWAISSSDRYIVLWAIGSSANGILAVAHKFPTMLQSVLQLFTNSWTDVTVADDDKQAGVYYTNVFRNFYILSFTALLAIIPATKVFTILVMSEAYKQSCDYVAFYYLGTVFQSFASFYGVGYLKSKKTGKAFSSSVIGAVINILVNAGLIWFIGLQAAAISTFAGFIVMWLVREYQNREELGIKIKWAEFMALLAIAVTMAVISIATGVWGNVILAIAGTIVFVSFNIKKLKSIIRR